MRRTCDNSKCLNFCIKTEVVLNILLKSFLHTRWINFKPHLKFEGVSSNRKLFNQDSFKFLSDYKMVCHNSRRVQSVMSAKKLFLVSDNLNLTFNLSKFPYKQKREDSCQTKIQLKIQLKYINHWSVHSTDDSEHF